MPPSAASSTTWLLVRIWPSEVRMMPEPEPAPWLPLTSILTTEGSTLAATDSTLPSVAGVFGVSTTLAAVGVGACPRAGRVVVVPGGVGRGAADPGAPAHQQGGGHECPRRPSGGCHSAASRRRVPGALGRTSRRTGARTAGWLAGASGAVYGVTGVVHKHDGADRICDHPETSLGVQKKIGRPGGTIAAMLRLAVLALTTALVLAGGAASAVVKNGGPGDDRLNGTDEADTLRGKGGNDRLLGLGGDDLLVGGPGNDSIKGGRGSTTWAAARRRPSWPAGTRPDRTYGGAATT